MKKNSSSGFSLVETLVALAIVMIILAAVFQITVSISKQENRNELHIQAGLIASKVSSEIFSQPGHFPALSSGGALATYIMCFDRHGLPVKTKKSAFTTDVRVLAAYDQPADICSDPAGIEVRITPIPGKNQYQLDVITMTNNTFQFLKRKKVSHSPYL